MWAAWKPLLIFLIHKLWHGTSLRNARLCACWQRFKVVSLLYVVLWWLSLPESWTGVSSAGSLEQWRSGVEAGSRIISGPSSCTQSWLDCTAGLHLIAISDIFESYFFANCIIRTENQVDSWRTLVLPFRSWPDYKAGFFHQRWSKPQETLLWIFKEPRGNIVQKIHRTRWTLERDFPGPEGFMKA